MSQYVKALGWAFAIILTAVAARFDLINEGGADATTMAIIVLWLSTSVQRNRAGCTAAGN